MATQEATLQKNYAKFILVNGNIWIWQYFPTEVASDFMSVCCNFCAAIGGGGTHIRMTATRLDMDDEQRPPRKVRTNQSVSQSVNQSVDPRAEPSDGTRLAHRQSGRDETSVCMCV